MSLLVFVNESLLVFVVWLSFWFNEVVVVRLFVF